MMPGRDRGNRVVESHSIARAAFRLAGVFGAVAAVWSMVVIVSGGSWWGPLHAFVAGTVVLAISGASQMFTVTWSAAPASSGRVTAAQRWLAAVGVAVVLVGVSASLEALVWIGAAGLVASLLVLGWSIRATIARSLLRRFDLSSRFYLTAFAAGVVGVSLGGALGADAVGGAFADVRLVHSHLNLIGLIGFTIIGTLPTFLATVAHHRVVSGQEAKVGWWLTVAAGVMIAAGLGFGRWAVGVGTALAGVAALAVLAGIVGRLRHKIRFELPFLQISLGTVWLGAWAIADGVRLVIGAPPPPFSGWTAAAVLAGIGQVLVGSLAYLLPVLAGPPLGPNQARMTRMPQIPLILLNAAGLAFILGVGPVGAVLAGLWAVDFLVRLAGLRRPGAGEDKVPSGTGPSPDAS